jgi:hypothetical protein
MPPKNKTARIVEEINMFAYSATHFHMVSTGIHQLTSHSAKSKGSIGLQTHRKNKKDNGW